MRYIVSDEIQSLAQKLIDSCGHAEYHQLMLDWTTDLWVYLNKYLKDISCIQYALDIGCFTGVNSILLSQFSELVISLDHENYLPSWKAENIGFHKTNLDSGEWIIPNHRYNICLMIEVLEHLKWSPIPLLKFLCNHVDLLFITTPDDDEWPSLTNYPWTHYTDYKYMPSAYHGCHGNPKPMFHVKQYKQHEFLELLSICGFRLIELVRIGESKHQLLAICQPRVDNANIALDISRAEVARLEDQNQQLLSQIQVLESELKEIHSSKFFAIYRKYHTLRQRILEKNSLKGERS